MDRNIAAGQSSACLVSVQRRDVHVKLVRRTRIPKRYDLHLETYDLLVIDDPRACDPRMISLDGQQVEGYGFQTKMVFMILIDQVALWCNGTVTVDYRETERGFGAFLI